MSVFLIPEQNAVTTAKNALGYLADTFLLPQKVNLLHVLYLKCMEVWILNSHRKRGVITCTYALKFYSICVNSIHGDFAF